MSSPPHPQQPHHRRMDSIDFQSIDSSPSSVLDADGEQFLAPRLPTSSFHQIDPIVTYRSESADSQPLKASSTPAENSDSVHRRNWSGGLTVVEAFLGKFSPTQTHQRTKSMEEWKADYHRQNQAFLRRAQSSPIGKSGSPSKGFERRTTAPAIPLYQRPPRASGKSKPLSSIQDVQETAYGDNESTFVPFEGSDDSGKADSPPTEPADVESVEALRNDDLQARVESEASLNLAAGNGAFSSYKNQILDGNNPPPNLVRKDGGEHKSLKDIHRSRHKSRSKRRQKEKEMLKEYIQELEKEKEALINQWKEEYAEKEWQHSQENSCSAVKEFHTKYVKPCWATIMTWLSYLDIYISNMPLTIGAVGLSWVTMGVVWFKFMEEMIDSCKPVHFYSPFCTFSEFPGCFQCDTTNSWYRVVIVFHYACHIVAGLCCLLFLMRLFLATRIVLDELSNPATSTPMGVVCIAMECVFAGRGAIGEVVVLATSAFHFCLAFWFIYMVFQYRLLPDPSFFPNTVGLAYAAIKTYLYYPFVGKVIMGFVAVFFFSTYFISLIRVAINPKISAPVCWIQLSAPSITLYSMTIMQQPGPKREEALESDESLMAHFFELHHDWYMPLQHFMMALSLIGLVSVLHSLWMRWPQFKKKEFSPAHAAFCFPTLSHTNAVQAYRGAVDAFSTIPPGSSFKTALWSYWFICLVVGSIVNIVFTYKFFKRIPQWTKVDLMSGEEEPPEPSDTLIQEMMHESGAGERMHQTFVSPAVLQANETGTLVRLRRGTEDYRLRGPYVRTRHATSLGFDIPMDEAEFRQERAALLDWVAKNAPRTRNRTLSIPSIMKLSSKGRGVYGTFRDEEAQRGHRRATTMDVFF